MAQPLNFGNNQMAHPVPLQWKTCKNPHFCRKPLFRVSILVIGRCLIKFFWKTFKKGTSCLDPGFLVLTAMAAMAQPLNFGNNQMAHPGPLQWNTCKNPHFCRNPLFKFSILVNDHSLIKFLLKNLQKRHFLYRSWIPPGLDSYGSYGPAPQFWERSDGTFCDEKCPKTTCTFDKNWIPYCGCQWFFL